MNDMGKEKNAAPQRACIQERRHRYSVGFEVFPASMQNPCAPISATQTVEPLIGNQMNSVPDYF